MHIKFNDLNKQFLAIKDSFYERLERLTETSQYILGQDVVSFEKNFAKYINVKHCIGVNSGTDALTLAAKALMIPNTLFIIQANTFIATIYSIINAIQDDKSHIQLIDCDFYGQMSPINLMECIAKNRNKYSKIIVVPVHMYGGCADMKTLLDIARIYNVDILEDSAQAHGTVSNMELKTGSIGNISAFSFYPGKNLGALGDAGCITTNDTDLYEKIIKIRNIGSNQKYYHTYPGYNSRLDSIQAIVLDEKLKHLDEWNKKRNQIAKQYYEVLSNGIAYNKSEHCQYHTYHLFLAYNLNKIQLLNNNIEFGRHYLFSTYELIKEDSKARKYVIFDESNFENTDYITKNHITLPIHPYMEDNEIEYVCNKISNQ